MGFFKKFSFKPFKAISRIVSPVLKNPVKAVKSGVSQALDNPARYTSGVLSGGVSEAWRAAPIVGTYVKKVNDDLYAPIFNAAAAKLTFGASEVVRKTGIHFLQEKPTMAFNTSGFLGSLGGILGNTALAKTGVGQLASVGLQVGSALTARTAVGARPSPAVSPVRSTAVAKPIASLPVARGLTREIFTAGQKVLARLGIPYNASTTGFSSALRRALTSVASLARRTPSGTMVAILVGLGLTAMEAYMLSAWHVQRRKGRRMNPANGRALRRAVRRIKSFHRLCTDTDVLKTRSRRSASRCGSCRKSPCSC